MEKVGIVGLGNMGSGMAATLLREGLTVSGFDLDPSTCVEAEKIGVKILPLELLLTENQVVILSLPKAAHVKSVSQKILEFGVEGLIVIDTSTSTPEVSREIFKNFQNKKMTFIDAPVSGGPKGARTGSMTMVVGASKEDFERVQPLLQKMSSVQVNVGLCGAGNIVKIGNNLLAAAHLITTAEMVSLANKAGVDAERFLAGINKGSGRSAVSEINFPLWILNEAYNSGFTMELMRKDVGLAEDLAINEGMTLPLSEMVMKLWRDSKELLADKQDFNEIVKMSDQKLFGGK